MMKHRSVQQQQHDDTNGFPITTNNNSSQQKQPTKRRVRKKGSSTSNDNRDIIFAIVSTFICTVFGLLLFYKGYTSYYNTNTDYTNHHPRRYRKEQRHNNNNNGGDVADDLLGIDKLPYNKMYRIPESMDSVGDRSNRYIELRKEYDTTILPIDAKRSLQSINQLHENNIYNNINPIPITVHNSDIVPYNIYDCPDIPPIGYPYQWNLLEIIQNWPVDDVNPPSSIHQGLCVFDYNKDMQKARNYQHSEVPFVVVNDPNVIRTVERWNYPGYVEQLMSNVQHRTEYSENNHFMYYVPPGKKNLKNNNNNNAQNQKRQQRRRNRGLNVPEGWKEPTQMIRMDYKTWLNHANVTDEHLGPDQPHWYYRLIGCGAMANDGSCDKGSSEYLFDELPFFQPKQSLYVVEPDEQKGIHCRFGMKGVIAENHFDGSRNSIVVLGGSRRYILTHPNQCSKLALYPKGHPSARHSAVDWSNPDITEYPEFSEATANEVVLQAGHVLYLPTNWFHFIVSLELNFQCNTRSGITHHYDDHMHQCGF